MTPARSNSAVTLSVRVLPETREKLELLAEATHRTKSFLAAEAIEHYLSVQAWQVKAIEAAVKEADSENAEFVSHEDVVKWINSLEEDADEN